MDLVQHVSTTLNIDAVKAEKGIGAILMALRLSSDRATFELVKQALPHSEHLIGRALMGGARTAELPAMIGPSGLAAALAAAGFDQKAIPQLGGMVMDHLRPALGSSVIDTFLSSVPALKG